MRMSERNKRVIYYAARSGEQYELDEFGNLSPDLKVTYYAPIKLKANVSGERGSALLQDYGIAEAGQRTIAIGDPHIAIELDSIFWIDCVPDENGEDGAIKHDYCVTNISRSIDSTVVSIKRVNVS